MDMEHTCVFHIHRYKHRLMILFSNNPFLLISIILLSCRFRLAYGADLWYCELVLQHHHSLGAVPCLFNDST